MKFSMTGPEMYMAIQIVSALVYAALHLYLESRET